MKKLNHNPNTKPVAKIKSIKKTKNGLEIESEKMPYVSDEDFKAMSFFAQNGFPIKH